MTAPIINVTNVVLSSSTLLESTKNTGLLMCTSTESQVTLQCPFPSNFPTNIPSIVAVTISNAYLANLSAIVNFVFNQSYQIPSNVVSSPASSQQQTDPTIANATNMFLQQNPNAQMATGTEPVQIQGSATWINGIESIEDTNLPGYTVMYFQSAYCLSTVITNTISTIVISYSADAILDTTIISGDELNNIATDLFNGESYKVNNSIAYFPIQGTITANILNTDFDQINICPPQNQGGGSGSFGSLTPMPTPAPITAIGQDRFFAGLAQPYQSNLQEVVFSSDNLIAIFDYGDKYNMALDLQYEELVFWIIYLFIFFPIPIPMWLYRSYPYGYSGYTGIDYDTIRNAIIITEDINYITAFGKFYPNIAAIQVVVNDLNGIKIYTIAEGGGLGELLLQNDFCNSPFIRVPNQGDLHIGDWQDLDTLYTPISEGYWNSDRSLAINAQFYYYNNHDLLLGGIRIGDFDGDGVDDLWCQHPATTKAYLPDTANEVWFAPLQNQAQSDRCDYIITVPVVGWCSAGIIKIGDFNFDKQSDALCIMQNTMMLLYGAEKAFISASTAQDGTLDSSISSTWSNTQNIYVGDFDGDHYADVLRIDSSSIVVLYGHKTNILINRTDPGIWFSTIENGASISQCYNQDPHKVVIADIDGDGRSDIVCDATQNSVIFSRVTPFTNPLRAIKIIVEDITLLQANYMQDIQRNNNVDIRTHSNLIPGDQQSWSQATSNLKKTLIQSVYFPFECLTTDVYTTEVDFTLSQTYQVNERVLWNYGDPNSVRSVYLDMSAQWQNGVLSQFISTPINFFSLNIYTPVGSCLKHTLINNYVTLTVTYNATAQMYISDQDQLITGDLLSTLATDVISSATLNEDAMSVTFPIQGHFMVNLLGVGYGELDKC